MNSDNPLCDACQHALPWLTNACERCSVPLRIGIEKQSCSDCQRADPAFTTVLAPWEYIAPITQLIGELKFRRRLARGPLLGQLFARWLDTQPLDRPNCLIAAPLHADRIRERGFNQADEVLRVIANETAIPVNTALLQRSKPTEHQMALPARKRRANVRGAFTANPSPLQHVAIFDDVMTTGHTANEMARTLQRAGVERVDIWTLARAARPN